MALGGGATLVALALGELALRWAGYDVLSGIEPNNDDPVLLYLNEPGGSWSPDVGYDVTFNRHGFRERDVSEAKAAGTYRIAAVGDSFTFGLGLPIESSWPRLLEGELESRATWPDVEVLNFGMPGYNTCQEDRLVERSVLRFSPDLVVLQQFFNDPDRVRWNPPVTGRCLPGASPAERVLESLEFGPRLGLLTVRALRAWRDRPGAGLPGAPEGPMAYLYREDGYFFRGWAASIGRLVHRVRAASARIVVVWIPHPAGPGPHGGQAWMCAAVDRELRRQDVPWLDLHFALPPEEEPRYRISKSDFHLDAEGNARVARALAAFLQEQVRASGTGG